MTTKLAFIISALLIVILLLAGVFLWNQLPEQMASHWNEKDEVNGYMGRFWGVFMLPLMMIGLTLLFFAIPLIDPLKANIAEFRLFFNAFIVVFNVYMAYIHVLTLVWNLGYTNFGLGRMMLPAIGLLFVFIGFMIKNAKRNYFIGIRTPWTLANDKVWDETHKLGSKLFIAGGIISLLGIVFPKQAIMLLMVPIFASALIPVVYSYFLFRREEKKTL
jgi:uncharacterized membrane protein